MEGISTAADLAARRVVLEDACGALTGLEELLFQAGGPDLAAFLTLVDRLVMAAELGRVRVTAEAMERGETGSRGVATSPAQWVRRHAPSTRAGGAAQIVSMARDLTKPPNAQVLLAVTEGRVPMRSAAAVIYEADRLRPLLAEGAEPAVVAGLITMAEEHGPRGARMVRPRLLAQYGLDDQLQLEQDAAAQFVSLSQPRENGPGIFEYLLTLDTEGHSVLEAAIGPVAAPRPTQGAPDLRTSDRRRGDALVQLVRRAVAAGKSIPTTTKAQLFVTMDYDRLAARLSSPRAGGHDPGLAAGTVIGGTHSGALLAPETVRRLACDATLIPLVLGTDREILDWGRAKRLFTASQNKRLWLRDGGCTYPGCDAPAQWCDAHHLVHWTDGGSSDLDNAVLLCGHHHQLVHRRRLAGTLADPPPPEPAREPDNEVPAPDNEVRAPDDEPESGTTAVVSWDLRLGSYDELLARRLAGEAA
jgi:hypothetical protein